MQMNIDKFYWELWQIIDTRTGRRLKQLLK